MTVVGSSAGRRLRSGASAFGFGGSEGKLAHSLKFRLRRDRRGLHEDFPSVTTDKGVHIAYQMG